MRQLWVWGWMPNYCRHIVASFLVEHLGLDWRHGCAWFHDTLVDADAAVGVEIRASRPLATTSPRRASGRAPRKSVRAQRARSAHVALNAFMWQHDARPGPAQRACRAVEPEHQAHRGHVEAQEVVEELLVECEGRLL